MCSLLFPIGDYRRSFVVPSKGKRDRKQKKLETKNVQSGAHPAIRSTDQEEHIPAPPDITTSLTVGYNSTIRCLENMSRKAAPAVFRQQTDQPGEACETKAITPLSAIFVDRSNQPSILFAQLPVLVATASLAEPVVRLISLPEGAGARISASLHIPRVSIIGVQESASNSGPLLEYIRAHVSAVEIAWLNRAAEGVYLPVNVVAKKTSSSAGPEGVQKQSKPLKP